MRPVLVQMSTRAWTMQAVHFACAVARHNNTEVILLRLIPVTHASYLGTSYGYVAPTPQEFDDLREYTATAEDYDVKFTLQSIQYVTCLDALADAAEQIDAGIVFAHIPVSRMPYWQKIQTWMLDRRLSAQQRQLFTLARTEKTIEQMPSIITTPAHSSAGK